MNDLNQIFARDKTETPSLFCVFVCVGDTTISIITTSCSKLSFHLENRTTYVYMQTTTIASSRAEWRNDERNQKVNFSPQKDVCFPPEGGGAVFTGAQA